MSTDAQDTLTETATAIAESYWREVPEKVRTRLGAQVTAREMAAAGWPPDGYARLLTLAAHAHAVQSRWDAEEAITWVITDAWQFVYNDRVWPEFLPWLVLLMSAPDPTREEALFDLVSRMDPDPDQPSVGRRGVEWDAWVRQVGPLAALAYAAGLTRPEACARRAAGTLAEQELRLLAGLRGWRLPDDCAIPHG